MNAKNIVMKSHGPSIKASLSWFNGLQINLINQLLPHTYSFVPNLRYGEFLGFFFI